jgi:hypothetical protein
MQIAKGPDDGNKNRYGKENQAIEGALRSDLVEII